MDVSKSDILEMLAREVESEPMRPDEFTIEMFMKRTGYSMNGARTFLDRKVRDGLLSMRKIRGTHCWINVYGKKE
jgi:hypothetical protein